METKEENKLVQARREKRKVLEDAGVNCYANDFRVKHTIKECVDAGDQADEEFVIAGRIVALRSFGKAAFARLRDRTGEVQIYIRKDKITPEEFTVYKKLDAGDFIGVRGPLFRTRTGELTVEVRGLKLLTKALRPLPEKWHGLKDKELRYRNRFVDLVMNADVRQIFQTRARAIRYIRDFLGNRGFMEVETPMMHSLVSGANAKPFITHHNALNIDLYLRIAPELFLKRLVVGGFERVFELNRNFRNEGISRKHNPEFTMLEFYMAYATYEDLIVLTEEMLSGLVKEVKGEYVLTYMGQEIDFTPPFKRLRYEDGIREYAGVGDEAFHKLPAAVRAAMDKGIGKDEILAILLRDAPDQKVPEEPKPDDLLRLAEGLAAGYDEIRERTHALGVLHPVFEAFVEDRLINPTFVTDYPVFVSPLARRKEADPALVDRFEFFIAGSEIANAFSELNDPDDQRERFLAQVRAKTGGDEEAMDYDENYIEALEYGMPPTAGEGIGIDRLLMLLTDSENIREVILFPLLRPVD
jgi:lysyl-tRNA synthetase class 2